MAPKQQRILVVVGLGFVMALGFFMLTTMLRDNLNGYATPADLLTLDLEVGQSLSVGGLVVTGSLQAIETPLGSQFVISDGVAEILVLREGGLPDLFAEDEITEVHGPLLSLNPLTMQATRVLAKHDQYYVPQAAQNAIDEVRNSP